MRIQHNIAAMNSYRNFSANNSSLNKNLEKLSTGYKINRAGDDAAGLAISEKMRAQITGLEGATKNSKDGISLIQTAEGALTEVHDMLNRMTTLAEQSANGTYQNELDREQLQKEVDALKSEIDRIADSTNFNGLKLLDGSLSDKFETTKTLESAITGIEQGDFVQKGSSSAITIDSASIITRPEARTAQQNAEFTVDLSDVSFSGLADTDEVTLSVGNTSITVALDKTGKGDYASAADFASLFSKSGIKLTPASSSLVEVASSGAPATGTDAGKDSTATWKAAYDTAATANALGTQTSNDNKYICINNNYYKMSTTTGIDGTSSAIKFTQVNLMDENADPVNPDFPVGVSVSDKTGSNDLDARFGYNSADGKGQDPNWHAQVAKSGLSIGSAHQARAALKVDFSQLKDGDTLVAGDKTYRFKIGEASQTTAGTGESLIDLSSIMKETADLNDADKQAQAMVKITEDMKTANSAVWTTGNGGVSDGIGTLTFQSTGHWQGDTNMSTNSTYIGGKNTNDKIDLRSENTISAQFYAESKEAAATTSFDLDVTKIKTGDTFTIDGKTFEFTDGAKASSRDNTAINLSSLGVSSGLLASQKNDVYQAMKNVIEGTNSTTPALTLDNGQKKYEMSLDGSKVTLTSQEDSGTTSTFESRVSADIKTPTETTYGEGLVLQIGDTADSYNKLTVSIEDMHTASLGIGDLDISTQDGAAAALDKIKSAINSVSDTRGNMGALQNRLEHTINNLGVMRENIQSAESVIRDTDVAEEMMAYTKNNILNQSAQAMLAQANQLPQGVLQLLG